MWYAAIRYHRPMDPQQYILSDRARSGLTGGAAMSRNSKLTIGIATLWLAGVLAMASLAAIGSTEWRSMQVAYPVVGSSRGSS